MEDPTTITMLLSFGSTISLVLTIFTTAAGQGDGGGAIEVVTPATVTCPEQASQCCGQPGVGQSNGAILYRLDDSIDESVYCNVGCFEEGHVTMIGPATATCPDKDTAFHCKDVATGDSLTATVGGNGESVYKVNAYFQEARCSEFCIVDEDSVSVAGPATVSCTTVPICRTATEDLAPTLDPTTGAQIFEIHLNVEARCDASCVVTRMLDIVGPAKVSCPVLGETACIDSEGNDRVNATSSNVSFEVPAGDTYYCNDQCIIGEFSVEVLGPAKVTCPLDSVKCAPTSGSSTTTNTETSYSLGDLPSRCSNRCTVTEESIQVTGPFEAVCPASALPCSPSTSSVPDGSFVTYSSSSPTASHRCSNKCNKIETMVTVHGPAQIECAAGTLNCADGVGGVVRPDGSSLHTLECGQSGLCSQSCMALSSGAHRVGVVMGSLALLLAVAFGLQ